MPRDDTISARAEMAQEARTDHRFLHDDVNIALGGLILEVLRHPFRGLVHLGGELREWSKARNAFGEIFLVSDGQVHIELPTDYQLRLARWRL